jgi:hypothetical protein
MTDSFHLFIYFFVEVFIDFFFVFLSLDLRLMKNF